MVKVSHALNHSATQAVDWHGDCKQIVENKCHTCGGLIIFAQCKYNLLNVSVVCIGRVSYIFVFVFQDLIKAVLSADFDATVHFARVLMKPG